MTTNILQIRLTAVCATLFLITASAAPGQRASVSATSRPPATSVLANFEKMSSIGRSSTPDEVRFPQRYSVARVDSVLAGLERIAATSTSGFQTSSAVSAIMELGSGANAPAGFHERVTQLYRSSKSVTVKNSVLAYMPEQKDRARAIAFLKSVAVQSGANRDFEYAPYHAAESLSDMGPEGRAVLLELQNKKLLQDGRAAGFTHWFLTSRNVK